MNKSQAMSLIITLKRYSKKKCGLCAAKYSWSIGTRTLDGKTQQYVKQVCSCSSHEFTKFDH